MRRDDLVRAADDRVGQRSDRLAVVEKEVRQAQAEALGRTGERLQDALDRLRAQDRRLDALLRRQAATEADGASLRHRIRSETESRNRLRDEAVRIRHHFIIQREALGFVRQDPVEQSYPVPGAAAFPKPIADAGGTP